MNYQKLLVPVFGVVLIASAWQLYGWGGVTLVVGGIVMWVLLHFNRMMQALRRTANRPIGYVDSAVMLNAKLKPGVNLLHVISLTRALGNLLSPDGEQPEIYRWTDAGESHVTCEFIGGKLLKWELVRPPAPAAATDS
ncbi:MAG: glycerate kinase [Ramlibacter sp.]|nr:glycerate kinase [Ramlibacter sp.]